MNPERWQPAFLYMNGNDPILIDCGEGAMNQLCRAGVDYRSVNQIFLTHHHFDHIGSLFACLGLNMMQQRKTPLTIYGPKGTADIVQKLCSACDVSHAIGFGVAGNTALHPKDFTQCIEIAPGDDITLADLRVTCCENTHYRNEDQLGKPGAISLSLRFDGPDRSVLFTGDTGPCAAVTELGKNVDLIVGELMDLNVAMKRVRSVKPPVAEEFAAMLQIHLATHHLSPEHLAQIGKEAGAKKLVAVHFPPGIATAATEPDYKERLEAIFDGEVFIGKDLAEY